MTRGWPLAPLVISALAAVVVLATKLLLPVFVIVLVPSGVQQVHVGSRVLQLVLITIAWVVATTALVALTWTLLRRRTSAAWACAALTVCVAIASWIV